MPASTVCADALSAYVSAAIADAHRPDTDRQRDADRKPADVIAFAGIKPGDKVADFMPGDGYFTRIFCHLVGASGHVYAISVAHDSSTPPTHAIEMAAASAAESPNGNCTNVTTNTLQNRKRAAPELWSASDDPGEVYEYVSFISAAELFSAPEPLDVIWTAENYHDLHTKRFGSPNLFVVNTAWLKALKPGGLLIVEDHADAAGSGTRDTETLHRIERAQVKREVTEAGFVFVAESTVLHNSHDRHSESAHEMHDKTDRFVLKFRKP